MTELLPSSSLLIAFLAASFIFAITPGPGVFYIVTRSLSEGRRAGLASVPGLALGNLCNAAGASAGLAAVFAASSLAFTIVKYAGALYLIYLGIRAFRASPTAPAERSVATPARRFYRDGFLVALLNPKTTLFFAAFLPQFMGADSAPMSQGILLGTLFVGMAALTDSVFALAAGSLAPFLTKARGLRAFGRYASAGAFVGLGLFTALTGHRDAGQAALGVRQ